MLYNSGVRGEGENISTFGFLGRILVPVLFLALLEGFWTALFSSSSTSFRELNNTIKK